MELRTKRLNLRLFTDSDCNSLFEILTGDHVLDYFPSNGNKVTIDHALSMIRGIKRHWEEHNYGLWAIENSAGELLGRAGLQYLSETNEIEIDFILGSRYWNQGFASEIGVECISYAFEKLSCESIVGIVHLENLSSQKVLHKIGMRNTGTKKYFGMKCYRYEIKKET